MNESLFDQLMKYKDENKLTANQMKISLKSLMENFEQMQEEEAGDYVSYNGLDNIFTHLYVEVWKDHQLKDFVELMYRWYCVYKAPQKAKKLTAEQHRDNIDSLTYATEGTLEVAMTPSTFDKQKKDDVGINILSDVNDFLMGLIPKR